MTDNATKPSTGKMVQKIRLSELSEYEVKDKLFPNGLNVIKDIKVKVNVIVGEAEITVQELLDLRRGEVLTLDSPTNDPVSVVVDGNVIAKGVLVAVDDRFGVRITEVAEQN